MDCWKCGTPQPDGAPWCSTCYPAQTDGDGEVVKCHLCGTSRSQSQPWCPVCYPDDPLSAITSGMSRILVRNYHGRSQADASVLFSDEAQVLATKGYVPISPSWAEGRPGLGRVLAIGLLANSIRPEGTLTVTYKAADEPKNTGPAEARMKQCPDCAEDVREEAKVCRFCRHEFDHGMT